MQRLVSEPLGPGIGHVTVYVSRTDKALGLAEWVFSSVKRLGRLQLADIEVPRLRVPRGSGGGVDVAAYNNPGKHDIIELQGDGGSFGHAYFYENPAVSSDVLLNMRFDRRAGAENGRPLLRQKGSFWKIQDDYLLQAP